MDEKVVETTQEETPKQDAQALDEITAEIACNQYASQAHETPDLIQLLVETTVLRGGREAFLVFRYGTRRFKATFEQVDRVRIPKGAAGGKAKEAA